MLCWNGQAHPLGSLKARLRFGFQGLHLELTLRLKLGCCSLLSMAAMLVFQNRR